MNSHVQHASLYMACGDWNRVCFLTVNTKGDNDMVLQRNGVEYVKLNGAGNVIDFSKGLTVNGFTIIKNSTETLKIEDTSNQRYIRFALGKHIDSFDGSNAHSGEFLYPNYCSQNTAVLGNDVMLVNPSDVIFHQPIKCNTFNSNGNNDVVLQRNGVEFMKFDSTDNKIHCPKELRIIGGAGKCRMFEANETTQNAFRIMNTEDTLPAIISFGVNANDNVVVIKDTGVNYSVPVRCNELDTNGDVALVFKRNSNGYMTFNQANDRIELAKSLKIPLNPSKLEFTGCHIREAIATGSLFDVVQENSDGAIRFVGEISNANMPLYMSSSVVRCGENHTLLTNAMNSIGDVDVVFQRNGVEYFRLAGANNIVNVAVGRALSSSDIYTNEYRPRSNNTNMVWFRFRWNRICRNIQI